MQKIVITINKTINFYIIKVWLYKIVSCNEKMDLIAYGGRSGKYLCQYQSISKYDLTWNSPGLLNKSTDTGVSLQDSHRVYGICFVFEQFI